MFRFSERGRNLERAWTTNRLAVNESAIRWGAAGSHPDSPARPDGNQSAVENSQQDTSQAFLYECSLLVVEEWRIGIDERSCCEVAEAHDHSDQDLNLRLGFFTVEFGFLTVDVGSLWGDDPPFDLLPKQFCGFLEVQ